MSKSGAQYRNPHVLESRKRKGGPHKSTKRRMLEEREIEEQDAEIETLSIQYRGQMKELEDE